MIKMAKDPVTGAEYLAEFYYRADPDYTGRTTVPALVDLETYEVVNNDYHRLTNYLRQLLSLFRKQMRQIFIPKLASRY